MSTIGEWEGYWGQGGWIELQRRQGDLEAQQRVAANQWIEQRLRGGGPFGGTFTQQSHVGFFTKEEGMLDKLKNVAQAIGSKGAVEGLVELAAYGRMLFDEYSRQGIKAPSWLTDALGCLKREIAARYRAEKEARALALEKEIEEMASREEKRKAKQVELAELRKELGG